MMAPNVEYVVHGSAPSPSTEGVDKNDNDEHASWKTSQYCNVPPRPAQELTDDSGSNEGLFLPFGEASRTMSS